MDWKNLKFKPERLRDGDWFVKTHTKKGDRYGFRYSHDADSRTIEPSGMLRNPC